MDIFVGNLSPAITEQDLKQLFSEYGQVSSVSLIKQDSSRATGFVEMPLRDEGLSAISALNGTELSGGHLEVRETTEKRERELEKAQK
jgi:RNA recognition motif-containing protein